MASPTIVAQLDALASRLSQIAREMEAGSNPLATNLPARVVLTNNMDAVMNTFLSPEERVNLMIFQTAHLATIRLFLKWRAFDAIPAEEGAAISYADLAARLGAEESLIVRFTRALVAQGTLRRAGTDTVAHTDFSRGLLTPTAKAFVQMMVDNNMTSFGAMPNYFSHFGLIEPPNINNTPLAFYENKLGTNIFDIIHATPERQASFMTAMTGFSAGSPPLGTYDLSWVLQHTGADSDPERALVVDAGGGKGQALLAMFEAVPDLPRNRCVLEDLPEVLDAAKKEGVNPALEGVQLVPFDLHAGQPVKGALVYYMRHILHDYSDSEVVAILRHVGSAMAPDSRLLIAERLLGSTAETTSTPQIMVDLVMMCVGGKARSADDFSRLLEQAGMKVTSVSGVQGSSSVIECALV